MESKSNKKEEGFQKESDKDNMSMRREGGNKSKEGMKKSIGKQKEK